MFEFIKKIFIHKEDKVDFGSTIDVPMPPCKPTRKDCYCRTDLQEVKYKKIEELAYYLAESDGFRDEPLSYWVKAEQQVRKEVG